MSKKPFNGTCVSEQGKSGLLWTVFEGEPFCSDRIGSFSSEDCARDYIYFKQHPDKEMLLLKATEHILDEDDWEEFASKVEHCPTIQSAIRVRQELEAAQARNYRQIETNPMPTKLEAVATPICDAAEIKSGTNGIGAPLMATGIMPLAVGKRLEIELSIANQKCQLVDELVLALELAQWKHRRQWATSDDDPNTMKTPYDEALSKAAKTL